MLLPEITKLAKLLLVLPATNAVSERSFSAMNRIKMYLRSTTSGNQLNHCMSLYVHCMLLYIQCKILTNLTRLKLPENSQATIKQDYKHLAGFENIKNSPRITFFFFFHCFSFLFAEDLKLDFSPLNRKRLPTPLLPKIIYL